TLSNRMIGIPTTEDLKDFYQSIGVVHQGTHPFDPVALLAAVDRTLLSPGRQFLTQMGLVFGIVVLLRALMRSSRIDRGLLVVEDTQVRQMVSCFARIAVWLAATNVVPLLAFPAYSANYQLSGANYLFLAIGIVVAIAYFVREFFIHRPSKIMARLESTKSFATMAVWLALTLSLLAFALWQVATYARFAREATAQMLGTDPHR